MKNWALILGASSGFGAATARAFANEGYGILGVHLDRSSTMSEVNKLIEDIKSKNVPAHFFNVNAADEMKRKQVLDTVKNEIFKEGEDTIKCMLHSLAFGTLKDFFADKAENDLKQKQLEM